MSVSQFTIYSSSDASGPGPITGAAGTLLALLDACLVNGYSGKTAAGWTKPFSNSGNIGCYKQGAGAGLGLVINDNGPNGTSTYKEAWCIGWEVVASVASTVGTGTGQFPTPAQLNTSGYVVARKSNTADSTQRTWVLFADASTFYLFILTGDSASTYNGLWYGDVYSLAGSTDAYRVLLAAHATPNSPTGVLGNTNLAGTGTAGQYMARSWGGTGSSINVSMIGDYGLAAGGALAGSLQSPNGPDNSFYLCPVRVAEITPLIRGRYRGLYQICNAASNFTDGQNFAGGGDFAGKTFKVVKLLENNQSLSCAIAIETSNTVETN